MTKRPEAELYFDDIAVSVWNEIENRYDFDAVCNVAHAYPTDEQEDQFFTLADNALKNCYCCEPLNFYMQYMGCDYISDDKTVLDHVREFLLSDEDVRRNLAKRVLFPPSYREENLIDAGTQTFPGEVIYVGPNGESLVVDDSYPWYAGTVVGYVGDFVPDEGEELACDWIPNGTGIPFTEYMRFEPGEFYRHVTGTDDDDNYVRAMLRVKNYKDF